MMGDRHTPRTTGTQGAPLYDGRYAAIDIGTVTCRMMVADVRAGKLQVLAKEYRITNLGEGVDATRRLLPEAMQRVEDALRDFLAVRATFDTPDVPLAATMVVATSAARDAKNADAFEAMLAGLGLQLQVISGAEEAALTFAGAGAAFPGERVMVVDIGGGSTEISVGCAGGLPEASHSFDIGCRRVTERFLHDDPPTSDQLAAASAWMGAAFNEWLAKVRTDGVAAADRMVAVAGTATTAVSIRERMEVYDSQCVDGACVSAAEVRGIADRLAALPLAERRHVVGLDPGRAPVIVAGMVILGSVMHAAQMDTFTVSESDILDGMILRLATEAEQRS